MEAKDNNENRELKSHERPDWVASRKECMKHVESWQNSDLSNEERDRITEEQLNGSESRGKRGEKVTSSRRR